MPEKSPEELRAEAAEMLRQADAMEAAAAYRSHLATVARNLASRLESLEADAPTATLAQLEAAAKALVAEASSILPSRTHHATIGAMKQARKVAKVAEKHRSGPPLVNHGPIARAAANAGLSMYELAEKLATPYSTVKTWNRRKGAGVPDVIRARLAKPPYSIPLDAWE